MPAAIQEVRERPLRLLVLVLCALGVVLHQWLRWDWFIDDAAIVFSYARTLVQGEGVVPWPGAERIEGFSDPTWLLLVAAFQALGWSGFVSAKPMAMVLSVATLVPVWRLARMALPDDRQDGALIAPVLLALNPQFAIWGASGLENSLFCLLLAVAVHRTLLEARSGGFPWASVAYLLLAWTRPEGVLYAAAGGAWFLVWTRSSGRSLRPVGIWLAVFWVPTLLLEAARVAYFAWPVPNTYYAKVEARGSYPFDWGQRGWTQLREYAGRLWQGYYLPVYVIGLVGTQGRRAAAVLAVVALTAATLLWPGPEALQKLWFWPDLPDPPGVWVTGRLCVLYALGALLPLAARPGEGARARILCWHSAFVGVVFAIWANGDWMGAYRWMSLISPMASVLLAVGLVEVADRVEAAVSGAAVWGSAGWLTFAFGTGLLIPPSLSQTRDHVQYNRNETPEMIRRRTAFRHEIADRAFYDGRVVNLDMDMGGALWWGPNDVQIDMAMLVDIPMGRHWFQQRPFIEEYVFAGARPTFAHLHGWWARHAGFFTYDQWEEEYFALPEYRDVPLNGWHTGMYGRRDLVVSRDPPGPGRRVVLEDGLTLQDIRVPVPTWPAGADGYVEVPISSRSRAEGDAEPVLILFLASADRVHSWELPMGYGLYPMAWWRPEEQFRGRHALPVPPDLPEGRYDLGLVALGADGRVLDVLEAPPGATVARTPEEARLAVGELVLPDALEITTKKRVSELSSELRAAAIEHADAGRCEEALAGWIDAKRARPRDHRWHDRAEGRVALGIADCLARSAEGLPDLEAAAILARAHTWDHHSTELGRVGAPIAERLLAEAGAARASEDWEAAFEGFEAVLGFQPWRSWARRWAEEARDHRLGLTGDVRRGLGGMDEVRPEDGEGALQ